MREHVSIRFASLRWLTVGVAAMVVVACSAIAAAAPNLADNFDSYAPNTAGTGWNHFVNDSPAPTPPNPVVYESAYVGVTDTDSYSGSNSLVHQINAITAIATAGSAKVLATPIDLDSSGTATLKLKVKFNQTNTTTVVTLLDDKGKALPRLSFTNAGTVWAYNNTSNANVTNMGTYAAGRWYELTISLNLPTSSTTPNTWGATLVDLSNPNATPLSTSGRTYFQNPDATATTLNRVSIGTTFGPTLPESAIYFDDINVEVPEPAAMAGITIAGGALMLRRRRRA